MAGADGGALPRSAKRRERVWARRLAAHQRVLVRHSHLPCHRVPLGWTTKRAHASSVRPDQPRRLRRHHCWFPPPRLHSCVKETFMPPGQTEGDGAKRHWLGGCLRVAFGFLEANDRVGHVGHAVLWVYPRRGPPCMPQLWSVEDCCNLTFGFRRWNWLQLAGRWMRLPHLVGEASAATPNAAALSCR